MKKLLLLLLFIPLVSIGQIFVQSYSDTIYYKPLVKYYAKEKESKLEKSFMNQKSRDGAINIGLYESPRDEILESEKKQKKHIITNRLFEEEYTKLHNIFTDNYFQRHYNKFSYYRDGSLARIERRILDVKNKTSDYFKKWVWSANPYENHYGIILGNRAYEKDFDYYVYDGITTIYSINGGWMSKYFWISGWYIDNWRNNDEASNQYLFSADRKAAQNELNRELKFNQKSIVDYYNIESLVKIFIEDCINNNLILPFFDFQWFKNETISFQDPDTEEWYSPSSDEVDDASYYEVDGVSYISAPVGYTELVIKYVPRIKSTFETLEGNSIALSSGYMDDRNIIIKIDPEMWEKSSLVKRWYILYHELGHDILNLQHGEGGKMMFNFINKEYTWDDFINDRATMFDIYKSKYDLIVERKKNQAYYKTKP